MSKLVQIPEATLETLLREAGRTESVDAYLRTSEVQAQVQTSSRLLKRARAAYWSRFWLFFSAFVTCASFLSGPNFEDFISGALLIGMTVVEFRVYALFLAADVRGAIYGWWNQCLFSALFLIYGGYHGTFVSPSPYIQSMLDPDLFPTIESFERLSYYSIGLIGALGQFWLACYYRSARKSI
jgi:hypothetical protein